MQHRILGRTGISVSRIGLGCVTFGREIDEPSSFRILDEAIARGINLLDTAESYGGGQGRERRRQTLGVDDVREVSGEFHSSEKIIGRWLASRRCRERVVLATKVATDFTPAHVTEALDASLKRLQTDHVDAYLFHSYDPKTPLDVAMRAIDAVVRSGKARAAGCSNFSAAQLRSALDISRNGDLSRFEVVQPPYNLIERDIEAALLPLCHAEQIGVVTYSPLAAGFLSGKYTTADRAAVPKGSRFDIAPSHADRYFSEQNFRLVEQLRRAANEASVPMTRLALAWVLKNPHVTSALIGATSVDHLENATAALDIDASSVGA